jgi:hypothetical protein
MPQSGSGAFRDRGWHTAPCAKAEDRLVEIVQLSAQQQSSVQLSARGAYRPITP